MSDTTGTLPPDAPPPVARRAPKGALARLMRRKLALFGLGLILLTVTGAVLAPWLTPYDPNAQMFDGLTITGAPVPPSAEDRARMVQADDVGHTIRFLAELPPHVCINQLIISPTWNRMYIDSL